MPNATKGRIQHEAAQTVRGIENSNVGDRDECINLARVSNIVHKPKKKKMGDKKEENTIFST
jgi:hypothetical protein